MALWLKVMYSSRREQAEKKKRTREHKKMLKRIFLIFSSLMSQLITSTSLTFSRCSTNESSTAIVSPFVSEVVLVKSKTKGNTMAFLLCDRG